MCISCILLCLRSRFFFYVYVFFSVSFFFFVKQKTAYEMRISDWSSDVCSSDLPVAAAFPAIDADSHFRAEYRLSPLQIARQNAPLGEAFRSGDTPIHSPFRQCAQKVCIEHKQFQAAINYRSEERRVGKECVSPGRSGGWPCH